MNEKYNRLQKLNHAHLKSDSKKPRLVAMFDLWNTLAGFTVTHKMQNASKQQQYCYVQDSNDQTI